MSNVVSIFQKKAELEEKEVEREENEKFDWMKSPETLKAEAERLKKERAQKNRQVTRDYRLK